MTTIDEDNKRSDICVFACTGHSGKNVARLICENGGTPKDRVLLLAGRDVDKVRTLYHDLMVEQQQNNTAVKIVVYPKPVSVDDDAALQALASQTRVLVNCVDVLAHYRALVGVAEACINTGTHYLDSATTPALLSSLFALKAADKCAIVPGCGFDYALPDVAVAVAERSFQKKYGENPTCVQLLFKIRTGPLGIKWPLHLVSRYFLCRKQHSPKSNKGVGASSIPSRKASILTFDKHFSSWTIPWFTAKDALQFLHYQRTKSANIDARLALPEQRWRSVFYVIYTLAVLIPVLGIVMLAKVSRFYMLQRFILYVLPALTLGVLTDNDDVRRRAARDTCADFVMLLQSDHYCWTYRVFGPFIDHIHQLCLTLAALELAERKDDRGGVLTPAQALLDTGFWTKLQSLAKLEVQSF